MTALALGTAQFGQAYGVTNATGALEGATIGAIIERARDLDVALLDTAHLYGDSEAQLGRRLADWPDARIVTKTTAGAMDADALDAAFRTSLARLGRSSVYALLAHRAADLLAPGGERLYLRMQSLRDAGLARKIGASVYDAAEIDALTARYPLDVVQLPASAFDQRLIAYPERLAKLGIETHLRSVFLQGLLLARPDRLTPQFAAWGPKLAGFHDALEEVGLSPIEGALAFAVHAAKPAYVVAGVTSVSELDELATAFDKAVAANFDFRPFAANDPELIDPRRWPAGVKAVA